MAVRIFLFSIFIVLVSSCKIPMLGLQREPCQECELRLDGYYMNTHRFGAGVHVNIYFFYSNGVVFYGGGFWQRDLPKLAQNLQLGIDHGWYANDRIYWGVHRIKDNKIQFEVWTFLNSPRERFLRSGKILNDTTFVITKVLMRGDVRYPQASRDTFHFKQFSPKPDSTNAFIPME